MRPLFSACILLILVGSASSQIITRSGEISGRVNDATNQPLPGVFITLQSNTLDTQQAETGTTGSFRFANLPPGLYIAKFHLSGFSDVEQENIRVITGGHVDLAITMRTSVSEKITITGNTGLLDKEKTGNSFVYTQEYLEQVPNGRDPWFVLAMTAGVDSSRLNTGTGSLFQPNFFGRGDRFENTLWNYDGTDHTDPGQPGTPPAYYDFEAFEEIQISTGGNDVSIQTGGIAINLVTKRGGNQWDGQASFFRNSDTRDYGFHAGGPVVKNKLFVWGGYRFVNDKSQEELILRSSSTLADINAKLSWNWNSAHSNQLGYFRGAKDVENRDFYGGSAPEALAHQKTGPLQGVWTLEHTWVPNDHLLFSGRYAFVGEDFSVEANGGTDKPMIMLYPIFHLESTTLSFGKKVKSNNIHFDANNFKENFVGGDHEFRFGFEYKASDIRSFSSYGNGVYIGDLFQTQPNGPLTSGYLYAQHPLSGHIFRENASGYFSDTFRKERLTLNLGLRFDHQTGKNKPSDVAAVPGFEEFVGFIHYTGGDPQIATNDFSPRFGLTYAVTKDSKTLLKSNFARYYDTFDPGFLLHSNPTAVYTGASFSYQNRNNDRTITQDELTSDPFYYGGNQGGVFNVDGFVASRKYDSNLSNAWTNEFILGIEREVTKDFSVGATFTYRRYGNFLRILPFGVTTADYVPGGVFYASTELGDFQVPYFVLPYQHDGTAILKNLEDYEQSYRGLDITLQKRMSNNFLVNGSLTIQRQIGIYNGGDSLGIQTKNSGGRDATYPFDPTNLPFLQDQPYAYAGMGGNPFSEWSLKFSGVYLLPWDASVGTFIRYQQGYPMVLFAQIQDNSLQAFYGVAAHDILVEPVGSRRYDNIFTADFQIQKSFDFVHGKITGILTIFNITNARTVFNRARIIGRSNFNQVFGQLDERSYRFGLRYSF